MDPYTQVSSFTCMWGSCDASFSCLSDLIGHVNLHHLATPSSPTVDNSNVAHTGQFGQLKQPTSLSCLWADCTSPGTSPFIDQDLLVYHLLHEHLGVPSSPATLSPHAASRIAPSTSPGNLTFDTGVRDTASPMRDVHTSSQPQTTSSGSSTPAPQDDLHSCTDSHECRWRDCGLSFASCSELTAHITTTHIGSGKAQYECFWYQCTRNQNNGFQSKQKICRHVQVSPVL